MKAKLYAILAAGAAVLLSGCGPTITNLTSKQVPQNASGIYTLSMAVRNEDGAIADSSFAPKVVVDGTSRPMTRSELGRNVFEYDYVMPEGRNEARYYYLLDYSRETDSPRQETSDIYDLLLTNRYVITLESLRGPVGAEIPVVGRGFTEYDKIVIGGFETDTQYQSPTSLTFLVPALPANASYRAELVSGHGVIDLGEFHVDGAKLAVDPASLEISPGERALIVFGIDFPASAGGLPVNVMTDIPASVIMPEVVIPAGSRTVSITVEGGQPGSGILFVSAPGYNEIEVPVTVRGASGVSASNRTPAAAAIGPAPSSSGAVNYWSETETEVIYGEADAQGDMLLEETDIIEITD